MEEDLFQLRQLPVVKFRRTGESARSEDDTASGEHEVQIEGVHVGLEAVELDDGAAVPKEFANPTDGGLCRHDVQLHALGKYLRPVRQENRAEDQRAVDSVLWHP
ncbi:SV2 related protein [Homo sapiens]|uniref:SV2 related protein n=1 Tax=Homo sapiens TaxID=9606 RepID=H0YHQ5_HUMAN|nr:SV2 related protein [Homo sapiens]KAI4068077.1 SV2 related protein [Homo sapiens]